VGLKYFNVKNGLTAGNIILDAGNNSIVASSFDGTTATFSGNLISNGISNLGVIANVIISGGSAGQSIVTDGAGNLSFATATSSMAPMPYQIDTGQEYVLPIKFQGLFSFPITIDGSLEIEGILVEV
jgi:hypothetical protein